MRLKPNSIIFIIFSCILTFTVNTYSQFQVPLIRGPVNDFAQVIPKKTKASLDNLLRELKKLQKSEIAVLTVKSLSGETIEQASIKVTDQWKLGTENDDNGILLIIAMQERRMRIEVGQGFEGNLTDSEAARIIHNTMIPLMKAGDPKSAVIAGLYKIIEQAYPELNTETFFKKHLRFVKRQQGRQLNKKQIILLILIILFIIYIHREGGGRGGFTSGGYRNEGFGGGSFGGGSFGGGGGSFGGGGGGFSGGGASGGW